MKFSKEHYEILKAGIAKIDVPEEKVKELYKNLRKRRFRWDLLWVSKVRIGDGVGIHGDINGDYNDENIDTALRGIIKDLNYDEIGY